MVKKRYKSKKKGNEYHPDYVSHPMETVVECLAQWLAENSLTKLTAEEWEKLLNREIEIDDKIATGLASMFGITKKFWVSRQEDYNRRIEEVYKG
jgi:plasmid maintenance system antidote protein VapI